jgi:hypothetical protein
MSDLITDPNRKGDISEYKATVWLLEQGYEVYKNVGCTGKVDIVAYKDDKYIPIQVKTLKVSHNPYKGYLNLCFRYKGQNDDYNRGIKPLWVYKDTVGWNRDYFDEESILNDWKTLKNQHITQ